jgi:hypothetical protein
LETGELSMIISATLIVIKLCAGWLTIWYLHGLRAAAITIALQVPIVAVVFWLAVSEHLELFQAIPILAVGIIAAGIIGIAQKQV